MMVPTFFAVTMLKYLELTAEDVEVLEPHGILVDELRRGLYVALTTVPSGLFTAISEESYRLIEHVNQLHILGYVDKRACAEARKYLGQL